MNVITQAGAYVHIRSFDHRVKDRVYRAMLHTVPDEQDPEFRLDPKLKTYAEVFSHPPKNLLQNQQFNSGGITAIGCPMVVMPPSTVATTEATADMLISIDAEWTEDTSNVGRRHMLSCQLAWRAPEGRLYLWIVFFPEGTRLSLPGVLGFFIHDLRRAGALKTLPEETFAVTLLGHYSIVDLTAFSDKQLMLSTVDSVRRTLVTITKPRKSSCWISGRKYKLVLTVRDTMLLSPAGLNSLANLGDALGYPKLDLPTGYTKDRMDLLLQEQPEAFIAYALRDVDVTLRWVEQVILKGDVVSQIPTTLGGIAATQMRQAICKARGWTQDVFDYKFRGLETVYEQIESGGRLKRQKNLVTRPDIGQILSEAAAAYYGGRNECFAYGPQQGPWHDFDLSGAYPTAMSILSDVDLDVEKATVLHGPLNPLMFRPDLWCFPYIDFAFPDTEQYPCIPVRDAEGRGLIYPLKGQAYATAPEIYLALQRGAKIRVITPTLVYQSIPGTGSTALGVKALVEARDEAKRQYGKGSPQEKAAKEIANSAYGKLAQGLADKRSYSPRQGASQRIGPSSVTSAPYAAMVTGLVRAVISAALCQLTDLGYRVASVTTDGFLSDAPFDVLNGLDLYGFRPGFQRGREYLVGDPTVWELKHEADSLVMFKTRGGAGVGKHGNMPLPAAAAGLRVSREGEADRAEVLSEVFLSRQGRVAQSFYALPSVRQYQKRDADAVGARVSKDISLEYDWKRELVNPEQQTVTVLEQPHSHVSCTSRPWATIEAFQTTRDALRDNQQPLKTVKDFHGSKAMIARHGKQVRARGGVDRSMAVAVLRGLRAGVLTAPWVAGLTGKAIAEKVGAAFGVELSSQDWKDAGRRKTVVVDGIPDAIWESLQLTRSSGCPAV